MRIIVVALPLIFALFALGCEPGSDSDIQFVNQTGEQLCYFSLEGDVRGCQEIEAGETRTYTEKCENNSVRPVTIMIRSSSKFIYGWSELCDDWDNVTVTISQRDGRFVVTDTIH